MATSVAVELVRCQPESDRAAQMLRALGRAAHAAGVDLTETRTYRGDTPWLLLWGPGAPDRAALMARHVAAGGRAIVLDLAYWQRDKKVRVSIDAAHPQGWVLRQDWPTSRLSADRVRVADRWNPTGHVVVAGLGRKARVQYGADTVRTWEDDMIRACRDRWPDRAIWYRRKQADAPVPSGVSVASDVLPIERVLDGASLLVTWHSNVAVDAMRLGIPVVCRDGAAAAVYPSTLGAEDPRPIATILRDRFLANLAWFQWSPDEAPACWRWLQEILA